MMATEKITYQIRVDKKIRDDFLKICKKQEANCAGLIRAFMKSYIELNKMEKGKKLKIKTIDFGLEE